MLRNSIYFDKFIGLSTVLMQQVNEIVNISLLLLYSLLLQETNICFCGVGICVLLGLQAE